jgi:hypothetical protein
MTKRERIETAVKEEFPGCTVRFADEGETYTRFAILDPNGILLSSASPHVTHAEIDEMDDWQLRRFVRSVCGLSPNPA